MMPATMLHEPRPLTTAELEYDVLGWHQITLRKLIHDLAAAYPVHDTPDHIVKAIDRLEKAADSIGKQMRELNGGSGA